jgi:hypothetical protein
VLQRLAAAVIGEDERQLYLGAVHAARRARDTTAARWMAQASWVLVDRMNETAGAEGGWR